MNLKPKSNIITIAFVVIIIYFAVLILKPYITTILASAILAYVLYPVYKWLKRKIKNSTIAALISSIIIVLIFTIPILVILVSLQQEAIDTYNWAKNRLQPGQPTDLETNETGIFDDAKSSIQGVIDKFDIDRYVSISVIISRLSNAITKGVTNILLTVPKKIIDFFIMLFLLYYFFKDGEKIVGGLHKIIRLKRLHRENVFKKIGDVIYAVIFGSIIVALIQGALGGIGFWALGIGSPLLWGLVMALCALLPYGGTGIVWFPASIYLIIDGLGTGTWYRGVILLIYGCLIVGTIDNFIRPKIIGHRGKIHPTIVLLGVLGGLAVFGFVGIILGPLVLALTLTIINLYVKSRK